MGTHSDRTDSDLANDIHAVLFSVGERMLIEELAKIVKESDVDRVRQVLVRMKEEMDAQNGPLMLLIDGEEVKLTVRSKFMNLVQKVVRHAEIPKSIVETLAVVAYKSPILQSDIIKIRTNKAYDHLKELEEKGYISREKYGRTKLVKVTPKFFEYFEISPEELQRKFDEAKVTEVGEQQEKITTVTNKVGDLQVYGKAELEQHSVTPYGTRKTQETEKSGLDLAKEVSDSEPEPPISDSSNNDNKELDDLEAKLDDKEPEKESKSDEKKGHDEKKLPENEKKEMVPKDKPPKKKKKSQESDQPYEPPEVEGGFTEYSEKEKEQIKERAHDLTHEEED
ncbi:SMC-Scp complex subunit ScpB [Candidatus Woesearchaeota archaeon]|nr:SMC-Scp complex subunit ScpB [Candidatus Woesearchaeota archaeon]